MIELTNPFPVVSAKILGVGVDIVIENTDTGINLCVTIDAVVWSRCWKWQR